MRISNRAENIPSVTAFPNSAARNPKAGWKTGAGVSDMECDSHQKTPCAAESAWRRHDPMRPDAAGGNSRCRHFSLDFPARNAVVCLTRLSFTYINGILAGIRRHNMTPSELNEITELILARIEVILEEKYHERLSGVTLANVAACVAFKADPELNELRLALERMERGEYGSCIFCKQHIPARMLREHPTAHFCDSCSAILRYRTRTAAAHAVR